jgi:hypothetical protein
MDDQGVHDHDGVMSHRTSVLPATASRDSPVYIEVEFLGFGIDPPFTGPIGYMEETQIQKVESDCIPLSFVDPTKEPQYYLDRYNNEPTYKDWFDTNFPGITIQEAVCLDKSIPPPPPVPEKLPEWVRNLFIWYAEKRISEAELLDSIQFLIDQGILKD